MKRTIRQLRPFLNGTVYLLLAAVLMLAACDDLNNSGSKKGGEFALAIRSADDAAVDTDYLVTTDDLMSGEITIVGAGVEQPTYHWYQQTGMYLTTVTYSDANVASVYKYDNENELQLHGQFSIERTALFSYVDDTHFLTVNIPFDASGATGTFYLIDAEEADIEVEKTVDMYLPGDNDEQAIFTGAVVRGDQVFVSFFGIATDDWDTYHTDSAYVAVYSYPGFEYQKTIYDDRTGPIGSYAGQGYIFKTEDNDIYTVSSVALGTGSFVETQHSGILKINAAGDVFDDTYFMDVEEATGGYKLCNSFYIGNGKMLASIFSFTDQTIDDKWSRRDVKLAIIDLDDQSLDYISGLPIHYGGPTGMMNNHLVIEDGKVYIKVKNGDGMFIYEIDPTTHTAVKGAEIVGADVYGFFDLVNP